MNIKYSIVTVPPVLEPIEINSQAKVDLKINVSDTDEDGILDLLIVAAREIIEERTGRSFITQTRVIKLDYFPGEIELSHGPVQSSGIIVTYQDAADATQTVSSSDYWVDTHSPIARIIPKNSWPSTLDRPNAITIQYVAGYGSNAVDVPYTLRKAIMFMVAHMYEHKSTVSPVQMYEIPENVNELISTFVITQYAGY